MKQALRAACGVAVFVVTLILCVLMGSTFIFQGRMFLFRNLIVLGSAYSVLTILSLVASYLLISDAIKSK
jgi:threonine/homoserine/homoserine lactone efflux protein